MPPWGTCTVSVMAPKTNHQDITVLVFTVTVTVTVNSIGSTT